MGNCQTCVQPQTTSENPPAKPPQWALPCVDLPPSHLFDYEARKLHSKHPAAPASGSSESSLGSGRSSLSVPPKPDVSAPPDCGYKLVVLSSCAEEYKSMRQYFYRSMPPDTKIEGIKRIQNPSLWKTFEKRNKQMGWKSRNRVFMFHGTEESVIESICKNNFDPQRSGKNGVKYGRGTYFTFNAAYADNYATANTSPHKTLVVALVLVGKYKQGSKTFTQPPRKRRSGHRYDSCVNNENHPSVFVIFDKQQIYPTYLIEYS